MNTRKVLNDFAGLKSLSVEFNADASLFAVSLETGFRIYDSERCEVVGERDLEGGIGAALVRDRSDCIGLVGGGKYPKFHQNKVIIWNDTKQLHLLKLDFPKAVQRFRLSREYIVVALVDAVILYSFTSPPKKLAEFETAPNPFGLCCLGKKKIAFPGRSHGQVRLVELAGKNISIIPTHSSPLRAITLSSDGEILATASENGTLVRVWSTSNCAKLAELRRGVDPAIVFSIAISPSSSLLAVTSDKSTLHLFDLKSFTKATVQPSSGKRLNSPGLSNSPQYDTATGSNHPLSSSTTSNLTTNSTPQPSPNDPYDNNSSSSNNNNNKKQKWGLLGKIPLMPRVFSDTYSFASVPFEIGDEPIRKPSTDPRLKRGAPSTTSVPSMMAAHATRIPPATSHASSRASEAARDHHQHDWILEGDAEDAGDDASYTSSSYAHNYYEGGVGNSNSNSNNYNNSNTAHPTRTLFSSTTTTASSTSSAKPTPSLPLSSSLSSSSPQIPGSPDGRPPKGQIGWLSDERLVVVGAGQDSRWERFRVGVTEDGRRVCYREGWRRYLS